MSHEGSTLASPTGSAHHDYSNSQRHSPNGKTDDEILVSKDSPRTGEKGASLTDVNLDDVSQDQAKFHKLTWPRLTIVLIVEAIALGSVSSA